MSDPFLVDLILDNLLANAIKYSPVGSAIVIGRARRPGRLVCTIADAGIGIAPADLARIFDLLYRYNTLAHRNIKSVGIGLSIVDKACALLGIERAVQSELGRGTVFTLGFPA